MVQLRTAASHKKSVKCNRYTGGCRPGFALRAVTMTETMTETVLCHAVLGCAVLQARAASVQRRAMLCTQRMSWVLGRRVAVTQHCAPLTVTAASERNTNAAPHLPNTHVLVQKASPSRYTCVGVRHACIFTCIACANTLCAVAAGG